MLKQRVITALILAPLIVALIFLTRASVFATLLGLIFLLGMWEWTRMAGVHGYPLRLLSLLGYAVLFALLWHVCKTPWWWLPVLAGLAWWLLALYWPVPQTLFLTRPLTNDSRTSAAKIVG